MALGDDFVFLLELIGRLVESFFGGQKAGAVLAAQSKISVLGDLLREGEVLLLRTGAPLLRADRRRALPEAAVGTTEDLKFPAYELMGFHGTGMPFEPITGPWLSGFFRAVKVR